jgi:hypothetical protein
MGRPFGKRPFRDKRWRQEYMLVFFVNPYSANWNKFYIKVTAVKTLYNVLWPMRVI